MNPAHLGLLTAALPRERPSWAITLQYLADHSVAGVFFGSIRSIWRGGPHREPISLSDQTVKNSVKALSNLRIIRTVMSVDGSAVTNQIHILGGLNQAHVEELCFALARPASWEDRKSARRLWDALERRRSTDSEFWGEVGPRFLGEDLKARHLLSDEFLGLEDADRPGSNTNSHPTPHSGSNPNSHPTPGCELNSHPTPPMGASWLPGSGCQDDTDIDGGTQARNDQLAPHPPLGASWGRNPSLCITTTSMSSSSSAATEHKTKTTRNTMRRFAPPSERAEKAKASVEEMKKSGAIQTGATVQPKPPIPRKAKKDTTRLQRREDWPIAARIEKLLNGFYGPGSIVWHESGEECGRPDHKASHPDALKALEALNTLPAFTAAQREVVVLCAQAAMAFSRLVLPYDGPGDQRLVQMIRSIHRRTQAAQSRVPGDQVLHRMAGFVLKCDQIRRDEKTNFMPKFDLMSIYSATDATYLRIWRMAVNESPLYKDAWEYLQSVKPFLDPQQELIEAPKAILPPLERLAHLRGKYVALVDQVREAYDRVRAPGYFDALSLRKQRVEVLGGIETNELEKLEEEHHDPAVRDVPADRNTEA